jgi:hypothetical protein
MGAYNPHLSAQASMTLQARSTQSDSHSSLRCRQHAHQAQLPAAHYAAAAAVASWFAAAAWHRSTH